MVKTAKWRDARPRVEMHKGVYTPPPLEAIEKVPPSSFPYPLFFPSPYVPPSPSLAIRHEAILSPVLC